MPAAYLQLLSQRMQAAGASPYLTVRCFRGWDTKATIPEITTLENLKNCPEAPISGFLAVAVGGLVMHPGGTFQAFTANGVAG